LAIVSLQKGNQAAIPTEFPKIKSCDGNLVNTEFMLVGYPIETINPDSGMTMTERYWVYKQSGKVEDIVYNADPNFQAGQYGVVINSAMTPTQG